METKNVGIVNTEFYRSDLGGFGGYGSLCSNLTNYYNNNSELLFKVFLGRYFAPQTTAHRAKVFSLQSEKNLLKTFLKFRQTVRNENIDLFLAIEWDHMYSFPLLNEPNTPLVIWLQDPRTLLDWQNIATCKLAFQIESNPILNPIGSIYFSSSYKIMKKLAQIHHRKIIPATQARYLREKGSIKYDDNMFLNSVFLPNPIQISDYNFAKSTKPTIVYLGRIDPIKRPWLFFELAKKMPEYDFLVAGTTHFPKIMVNLIEEAQKIPNLHFLGLVGGVEKREVLAKSWILVNTSIHEALPVSFLEALSYGTPIVSNRNPDGITEKYGIHIKNSVGDGYESIPAFVKAIKILISDEKLRATKAQKGYEYVRCNHSFKTFNTRLNEIFEGCR